GCSSGCRCSGEPERGGCRGPTIRGCEIPGTRAAGDAEGGDPRRYGQDRRPRDEDAPRERRASDWGGAGSEEIGSCWWVRNKSGAALSTAPLCSHLIEVARDGIDPPTRGFSVRCSTN